MEKKLLFTLNLKVFFQEFKRFSLEKVFLDSMRSYLFKEEYIFGMYGIESRYPFWIII